MKNKIENTYLFVIRPELNGKSIVDFRMKMRSRRFYRLKVKITGWMWDFSLDGKNIDI